MVGRLYGGTQRMYDKYYDFTPDDLEMAILAQNATDQFTDPALTPLNSEDAMERFQLQLMKTSTPEIRIPSDEDKTLSNRRRARELINLIDKGGPRGSTALAYKPELVQSNRSTYTYEVPSTDPIVASRGRDGSYHSDSSGNTVFRMNLPNNQTNAELGNKMFNFVNNRAKYAAAVNRVENTSQMVDFIPGRKDRMWISRALDETRHRLMPKIEIYTDNGDNTNREKNKCRDTERISYKYRHKEYDVDRTLSEVLDNGMRIKPEIGPRETDGTPMGNLVAQLSKQGLGYALIENDIINMQKHNKYKNPNRGKDGKISQYFDNTAYNSLDDKDGKVNDFRPKVKVVSKKIDEALNGLDDISREILMSEVIDDIKNSAKGKPKIAPPRKTKSVAQGFDVSGHNTDDDEHNNFKRRNGKENKSNDIEREIMSIQIPLLTQNFRKDIIFAQSNSKIHKANTSGQKRGYTIDDTPIAVGDDRDNIDTNRNIVQSSIEKITGISQGVRGLINELVPDAENVRGNTKINPNRRIVHGSDGKILKYAANNSELFDEPDPNGESAKRGTRNQISIAKGDKRPKLASGYNFKSDISFEGSAKKPNKKRKTPGSIRDY